MESKATKRPLYRSGLSFPWDSLQVSSWAVYLLNTAFCTFAILKNESGLQLVVWIVLKAVLGGSTVFATVWTVCSDPTDELFYSDAGADSHDKNELQNHELVGYCEYCDKTVLKESKHCKRCDRCVRGFDHHCRFVNQCVGARNYRTFIVLVIISSLDLSFMLGFLVSDLVVSLR